MGTRSTFIAELLDSLSSSAPLRAFGSRLGKGSESANTDATRRIAHKFLSANPVVRFPQLNNSACMPTHMYASPKKKRHMSVENALNTKYFEHAYIRTSVLQTTPDTSNVVPVSQIHVE